MQDGNNTIWKAIAKGSAVVILGALFYYFMTMHFAYTNRTTGVLEEFIRTEQKLIDVVDQLKDAVKHLDYTISMPEAKEDLRAKVNGYDIVKKLFPIELDKKKATLADLIEAVTMTTTTAP